MELLDIITQYGWRALVVTIAVFALIECLKPVFRKLVPKENARHTIYTLLNFGFTLGFSALLSWILNEVNTLWSIYGASIIVVNISYPIIANIGFFDWISKLFGGLLEKTNEGYAWKRVVYELASQFGVDPSILDKIATKVEEEYLDKINAGAELFFGENVVELTLNIKQKLAGFVSNDKLQEVAELLYTKLKESWVK